MTSVFAEVIGDPIEHSKSPVIHLFWLEKVGLDFDYRATQVTRAGLGEYLRERRQDPNWRGCNVTMPLKLDAVIAADDASDRAVAAGAANILVPTEGKLLAGNTDVGAVLQLLGPRLEKSPGASITLLGNGGAARAVLVALRMLGVDDVRIQARDQAAAYKLAVEFGHGQEPQPFTAPVASEGLVNATPMGMPGVQSIAMDISGMPAAGWVFDLVTTGETPLLAAAGARGLATIDGLAMLVEQAADSFRLLFGQDAPRQYDAELMGKLRP
jgi:shikimate dehydrogenase